MESSQVLQRLIIEFPDRSDEVKRLFVEHDSFREAGSDYVKCLHLLNKKQHLSNEPLISDFLHVRDELRSELLQIMDSKRF
jgi:hypothetical protein